MALNNDTLEFDTHDFDKILWSFVYFKTEFVMYKLLLNAFESLDKKRENVSVNPSKLDSLQDLRIEIIVDRENKVLTIRDSGTGLTQNDLLFKVGSLRPFIFPGQEYKPGMIGPDTESVDIVREFLKAFNEGVDVSFIGQVGIGVHSASYVSKRVELVTKHDDDEQYCCTIHLGILQMKRDIDGAPIGRGTLIRMHLRDEYLEFLEESRIKEIIKNLYEMGILKKIDFQYLYLLDEKDAKDENFVKKSLSFEALGLEEKEELNEAKSRMEPLLKYIKDNESLMQFVPCLSCGYLQLDTFYHSYEICRNCLWQDDVYPEDEPDASGANQLTLPEAQENYRKYGVCEPRFLEFKSKKFVLKNKL